jgi:UDP-N-acetyl-2-amino-2-deoxyglucuronate dehydrogenase
MTIHIGILGGGNISQTHSRAAREIPGVEITGICGQNQKKVKRLTETYGGSAYESLDAFLRHRPMEIVLIGSPSGLHAEHGIAAAKHGLHVLVEKPIDITVDRADALINACDKAKVKLGVFFQDRVSPDILKLKGLIDSGKLGRPVLMSARVKWYRPSEYYEQSRWRGTWALDGGGAMMNQGIHTVDLLLWLLGDLASIQAKARTALHDIEVEDTSAASLEFSSGAIGTLEVATSVYPGYPRRLELTWSEGTIIVENDRVVSVDLRATTSEFRFDQPRSEDERSTSPVISDVRGHRTIIEDFIRSIQTNGTPICDGNQARRSVEVVRSIYESARTGQVVSVGRRASEPTKWVTE